MRRLYPTLTLFHTFPLHLFSGAACISIFEQAAEARKSEPIVPARAVDSPAEAHTSNNPKRIGRNSATTVRPTASPSADTGNNTDVAHSTPQKPKSQTSASPRRFMSKAKGSVEKGHVPPANSSFSSSMNSTATCNRRPAAIRDAPFASGHVDNRYDFQRPAKARVGTSPHAQVEVIEVKPPSMFITLS